MGGFNPPKAAKVFFVGQIAARRRCWCGWRTCALCRCRSRPWRRPGSQSHSPSASLLMAPRSRYRRWRPDSKEETFSTFTAATCPCLWCCGRSLSGTLVPSHLELADAPLPPSLRWMTSVHFVPYAVSSPHRRPTRKAPCLGTGRKRRTRRRPGSVPRTGVRARFFASRAKKMIVSVDALPESLFFQLLEAANYPRPGCHHLRTSPDNALSLRVRVLTDSREDLHQEPPYTPPQYAATRPSGTY